MHPYRYLTRSIASVLIVSLLVVPSLKSAQHLTAVEAATLVLDGAGWPATAELIEEVARVIVRMQEICQSDVGSMAAVLSMTYGTGTWEMIARQARLQGVPPEEFGRLGLIVVNDDILGNLEANKCKRPSSATQAQPYELPIIKNDHTPCLGSDMSITCPEPWVRTQRTFASDFYDRMGWHCQTTKRYCVTTSGGEGCMCQKLEKGASRWRVLK